MAKTRAARVLNMKLIREERKARRAAPMDTAGGGGYGQAISDSDSDVPEYDDDDGLGPDEEALHQRLEDTFNEDCLEKEDGIVIEAMSNLPPLEFVKSARVPKSVSMAV